MLDDEAGLPLSTISSRTSTKEESLQDKDQMSWKGMQCSYRLWFN
jgi:hypothetical protein